MAQGSEGPEPLIGHLHACLLAAALAPAWPGALQAASPGLLPLLAAEQHLSRQSCIAGAGLGEAGERVQGAACMCGCPWGLLTELTAFHGTSVSVASSVLF